MDCSTNAHTAQHPTCGTAWIEVPWHHALPGAGTGSHVYELFDADGAPVYVGVTGNARSRVKAHVRKHPEIRTARITTFKSRPEAEAFERERIMLLEPPLNVARGTGRFGG